MKITRSITLIIFTIGLTGCDKITQILSALNTSTESITSSVKPDKEEPKTTNNIEINIESPDLALKTWWRYLDQQEDLSVLDCKKSKEAAKVGKFDVSKISTGELEAALKSRVNNCNKETFEREIRKVKLETETRAIALVTIRNSTPSTAAYTEKEEEERLKGEEYKYLIERSKEGWKIAQVYHYSETNKYLNKELWGKEYTPYVESYPTYVFGNQ